MNPAPPERHWFPRPAETALAAAGGGIALVLAAFSDPAGRVLLGVAGLGLLVLAATDLLVRPRLSVDPHGLRLRTLSVRRNLPWDRIERVVVDERRRLGLTARALEVDAGETLVVLGRRSLGADPRDVAGAVARIRYTAPAPD
jgi:Bacterial PH domain